MPATYKIEVQREGNWFSSVKYPGVYTERKLRKIIPLPLNYRVTEIQAASVQALGVAEEENYPIPVLRTTRARADNPPPERSGPVARPSSTASVRASLSGTWTFPAMQITPWVIQRRRRGHYRNALTEIAAYRTRAEAYNAVRPMRADRRYVFRVEHIPGFRTLTYSTPETAPGPSPAPTPREMYGFNTGESVRRNFAVTCDYGETQEMRTDFYTREQAEQWLRLRASYTGLSPERYQVVSIQADPETAPAPATPLDDPGPAHTGTRYAIVTRLDGLDVLCVPPLPRRPFTSRDQAEIWAMDRGYNQYSIITIPVYEFEYRESPGADWQLSCLAVRSFAEAQQMLRDRDGPNHPDGFARGRDFEYRIRGT